ncbi:uncharacterized protein LOC121736288 [Aricia agestis]|uniref:uncharacterized protein LOC121736288 n=1 Tax=Aricia agestis TaxID=91739 RepID=UPI001C201C9F|nr:uncharacterized protein LOC121736288 [Aricia agestis]XP_041983320.1 uncharacterized protein LOC121736288 [Aricia agestis]
MAKKRNAKKKAPVKNDEATNKVPLSNNINSEAIAAALSTTNLPVLLKLCRLCETKDGPFLNIFDSDKIIAKKIEDLMPFVVAENDDLPHKICFRCSAKVEELHEFIQKCVKTQVNLRRALGQKTPLPTKLKHRALWEEKLNESNISNEAICDALVKKAMESIKEPLKSVPLKESLKEETKMVSKKETAKCMPKEAKVGDEQDLNDSKSRSSPSVRLENQESKDGVIDDSDIPLKKLKLQIKKSERNKAKLSEETPKVEKSVPNVEKSASKIAEIASESDKSASGVGKISQKSRKVVPRGEKSASKLVVSNIDEENPSEEKSNKSDSDSVKTNTFSLDSSTKPEDPKPFNILDHITMIKVNSVGVLYQCKLCNRNFLKKEVIMTHGCAKSGGAKKNDIVRDVPKPELPKMPTVKYINTKSNNEPKKPLPTNEPINLVDDDEDKEIVKPQARKPKIGPASKVKKSFEPDPPSPKPVEPTVPPAPVFQLPQAPSVNGRYKLVPGPNNTFTLVEEGSESALNAAQNPINPTNPGIPVKEIQHPVKTKASKKMNLETQEHQVTPPYPVGLFQTVPHNSNSTPFIEPPGFTTPAMKKQSYTIVQTGNPNKLLISTRTQPEEVPLKKLKKSKHETKNDSKEPFSVTLEDAAPPRDPGIFTFINVDPLLQPSYVLPTDNIIQESQITTTNYAQRNAAPSTANEMYTCNMCNLKFDREKKLLTHIQSHYNQMDLEDEKRHERKRTRSKK